VLGPGAAFVAVQSFEIRDGLLQSLVVAALLLGEAPDHVTDGSRLAENTVGRGALALRCQLPYITGILSDEPANSSTGKACTVHAAYVRIVTAIPLAVQIIAVVIMIS